MDVDAVRKWATVIRTDLVAPGAYTCATPVSLGAHSLHGEPIPYAEAAARPYEPFHVGGAWGSRWDTTWFQVRGRVPDAAAGHEVVLRFETDYRGGAGFGAEALAWRDGVPVQGLSPFHTDVLVAECAAGGEPVELHVEAAANPRVEGPIVGEWPLWLPDPDGEPLYHVTRAELAVRHPEVLALVADLSVATGLLDAVDVQGVLDPGRRAEVAVAVQRACEALDPEDIPASAPAARIALAPVLRQPARPDGHRVSATGHAHIDTAWLWPMRETRRKCARTFATALALMDADADHRFSCSQPQQYAWVEQEHPALFERIRRRVAEGRWEPVGAMWVEPDCNLASGEALVRQLVHGKRYFLERFGVEVDGVWLPDVFGYPGSLPQIMRAAGVRWFLTQKLSWNDTNRFPHSTFTWEGIDGSRVLAHFPPADTYNGSASLPQVVSGTTRFPQDGVADRSLYLFGWGDGGGGPTPGMVRRLKRMRDLDGAPAVTLEPAATFFARLEAESPSPPVWVGELYFEKHRGTLTSQAATKRGNRRGELRLLEAELWAAVRPGAARAWPGAALDRTWKRLLTQQFHDILPGSSIHWVHDDAVRELAEVETTAEGIAAEAAAAVAAAVDTTGRRRPVVVLNPSPAPRRELVDVEGRPRLVELPALGYVTLDADTPASDEAPGVAPGVAPVEVDGRTADNGLLRVTWDDRGLLTSVFDLEAGREVLAPGRVGNLFQLHVDTPVEYDAWDIDRSHLDGVCDLVDGGPPVVVERSSLRARVRFRRETGESSIDQEMVLTAGSRRLDFVTRVDWRERHRLLKVAFPVRVRAAQVSFAVQFGHVQRPTHENTSWDRARFEVCGQGWADLSEAGYGVALLSDCKYGYDVRGSTLRLSLLRGPTAPDPQCDVGQHVFTYALLPHRGDLAAGGVVAETAALQRPVRIVPTTPHPGPLPPSHAFVPVDDPGCVVETVKRADHHHADQDGALVVRLHEAFGGHRRVRLAVGSATSVVRTDLLERPLPDQPDLAVSDGSVLLELRPFELVTLLVR